MTEWYVLMSGNNPILVVLGRRDAVTEFMRGFRLTPDEKKRAGRFVEAGLCPIGEGLHAVGYEKENGERVPDRRLVRCVGPGTEV